jgi:hypothetical protein
MAAIKETARLTLAEAVLAVRMNALLMTAAKAIPALPERVTLEPNVPDHLASATMTEMIF